MSNYTIQAGDNLTRIAKANNTTVEELARINNISNPNKIQAGQTIKLFETPAQPVAEETQTEVSYDGLEQELASMQNQLSQMQSQMDNQENDLNTWEMFGLGLAGVATYKTAEKTFPYAWNGAKSVAKATAKATKTAGKAVGNVARETGSVALNSAQNLGGKIAQGAKHIAKKVELEYAFGKEAVKEGAQNASKAINRASKNGSRLMGVTKAGKVLTKASPFVATIVCTAEVVNAYNKGGTKAAVKQGAKSASGLACAAAGAKIGLMAGACTGPAAPFAVPFLIAVGSIAGYFGGEKLVDKITS